MYVNFKQLYKSNISESEFLLLFKIAQRNIELITEEDKPSIDKFIDMGLTELTKQGITLRDKIRISKKGKQFLRNIGTANYTDDVQNLEQELVNLYEDNQKEIGLRAEVKSRLTWFVHETGFRPSVIKKYVERYLEEADPKYIKNLSNLIWTPQSRAFSTTFALKDSKLFDIICQHMRLDQLVFLDKRDKELHFLFEFGSTKAPKGLKPEYYFTGSYEGDKTHSEFLGVELTKRILK